MEPIDIIILNFLLIVVILIMLPHIFKGSHKTKKITKKIKPLNDNVDTALTEFEELHEFQNYNSVKK